MLHLEDGNAQCFHDEGVLIFCILVPLGYPLLYSWIYNNEVVREVDTAIVDLSHSHTSREFIRDYDASPDVKATYYCNSLDEAKQLVQRQAVHGIVYIPADFDTKLNRGEQAHVGVYCDMSLMLTYKAISRLHRVWQARSTREFRFPREEDSRIGMMK